MTKTAEHTIQNDLSHGQILVALSAENVSAQENKGQEIKIAPRGKVRTRDERAYEFEPEVLVARFQADGIELPVDLEHSLSSFSGESAKGAIGWISNLIARDDGLYGVVEWLDAGRAALEARTHRYLSPTFRHDEFGKATWLHSVALVAAPALPSQKALAHAEVTNQTEEPSQMSTFAKLAAKLGLTDGASEDAMIAALTAKLENTVDKGVHDEAVTSLAAKSTELAQLKTDLHTKQVDVLLEAALKDKKIIPAQREHYAALCATPEGYEHIKGLLDVTTASLTASGLDDAAAPGSEIDTGPINSAQLAADAQAYQGEMAAKGVVVPIDQAVDHVLTKKKTA